MCPTWRPVSDKSMRHPARWPIASLLVLIAAALMGPPARAAQYYLAVDVPTNLGGTEYTPNQILRVNGGVYVVEASLPANFELAAMVRTPKGVWLLVPAVPIDWAGQIFEPRDIVAYDAATGVASMALDGGAAGIPDYAAIDALLYDPVTALIAMSFDVPVQLAGFEYGPSDLVTLGAGFSLMWSAAAAGVPLSANVVGAERDRAGTLVLTFDVPVTLGGTTFLSGQLVQWNGGALFAPYAADPSWPLSSVLADFAFIPAAGEVPDRSAGSVPLTVQPAAGGQITLSWGASCAAGDTDYEVYEGKVRPPFDNHVPITCSTKGATSWTFTPSAGDRYYYVVPRNAVSEGSYGRASDGAPRLPSTAACLPQEALSACGPPGPAASPLTAPVPEGGAAKQALWK